MTFISVSSALIFLESLLLFQRLFIPLIHSFIYKNTGSLSCLPGSDLMLGTQPWAKEPTSLLWGRGLPSVGRQILTNKWTMSSADIPAHKAGNRVRRWCWCTVLKKRVSLIRGHLGIGQKRQIPWTQWKMFMAEVAISRIPGRLPCNGNMCHQAAGAWRCPHHHLAVNTDILGKGIPLRWNSKGKCPVMGVNSVSARSTKIASFLGTE